MARVLFHIDLNAFYASAEELRHPEYKGLPVAVGSLSARSVLSTANYEARSYGVHSAMPVSAALKLCPELKIVEGDYNYYRSLSRKFFDYLRQYSVELEILSVDECFLDVTEVIKKYKRPLDLAVQIQQGVLKELGLRCSIGVAPTKFLAKMASDMHKPMGITVLRKSEIPSKLWKLPIGDIVGLGKKTAPLLEEKGIKTIGDLADPDNRSIAEPILKNSYLPILRKINGQSSDRLSYSNTRKSISHSVTFGSDLYSLEEVLHQGSLLVRDISEKMQKAHKKGSQLSITLRDTHFHNVVRSVNLKGYTNAYEPLYQAAENLLVENFEPVGYRLIGITIGSLQDEDQIFIQQSLFEKPEKSFDILDSLNNALDSPLLMKASDLLKQKDDQKGLQKNEKKDEQQKKTVKQAEKKTG